MAQTIQQTRAAFALKRVHAAKDNLSTDNKKEFRSYANALPAMIHMNGLGQAAAFCCSKEGTSKGPAYMTLYILLSDWLTSEGQPYHGQHDLLDGITQADMHLYRVAQAEALELMDWVKKFTLAFIPKEPT